ncbi:MAG: phytase, partial [Lutimonas sp.]
FGIRKYYADPEKGDTEISLFGGEHFKDDLEGICILKTEDNKGYLIVSNQGDNSFNVFKRDTNSFVKKINLGTKETDGCDITTVSLGEKFPNGLLVTMNDEGNFFFHDPQTLGLEK